MVATSREQLLIEARLVGNIQAQARDLQRSIKRLGDTSTREFSKIRMESRRASGAMALLSRNVAGLAATFAAGFGIRRLSRDVAEFNRAIAEVSTIINTSEESVEGLADSVLELARAQGLNETLVSRGLYQAISSGVGNAGESLIFLEEANKLAVGGLASSSEAVDLLTSTLNAYNLTVDETGRLSDIFFKAVQRGKTTIPELAAALGQVLPIASQLGVSVEEVAAAVANLTLGGLSTSEAVTNLRSALVAFLKKAELANSTFGRQQTVLNGAAIRTKGLAVAFQDLVDATGGSEEKLVKLIGRVEGVQAVLGSTGKNGERLRDVLNDIQNSAGVTNQAFAKIESDGARRVQVAFQRLRQQFVGIARQFAEPLALTIELASGFDTIGREVQDQLQLVRQRVADEPIEVTLETSFGSGADSLQDDVAAIRQLRRELEAAGDSRALARLDAQLRLLNVSFDTLRGVQDGGFFGSSRSNQRRRIIRELIQQVDDAGESLEGFTRAAAGIEIDIPAIGSFAQAFEGRSASIEDVDAEIRRVRQELVRTAATGEGSVVDLNRELDRLERTRQVVLELALTNLGDVELLDRLVNDLRERGAVEIDARLDRQAREQILEQAETVGERVRELLGQGLFDVAIQEARAQFAQLDRELGGRLRELSAGALVPITVTTDSTDAVADAFVRGEVATLNREIEISADPERALGAIALVGDQLFQVQSIIEGGEPILLPLEIPNEEEVKQRLREFRAQQEAESVGLKLDEPEIRQDRIQSFLDDLELRIAPEVEVEQAALQRLEDKLQRDVQSLKLSKEETAAVEERVAAVVEELRVRAETARVARETAEGEKAVRDLIAEEVALVRERAANEEELGRLRAQTLSGFEREVALIEVERRSAMADAEARARAGEITGDFMREVVRLTNEAADAEIRRAQAAEDVAQAQSRAAVAQRLSEFVTDSRVSSFEQEIDRIRQRAEATRASLQLEIALEGDRTGQIGETIQALERVTDVQLARAVVAEASLSRARRAEQNLREEVVLTVVHGLERGKRTAKELMEELAALGTIDFGDAFRSRLSFREEAAAVRAYNVALEELRSGAISVQELTGRINELARANRTTFGEIGGSFVDQFADRFQAATDSIVFGAQLADTAFDGLGSVVGSVFQSFRDDSVSASEAAREAIFEVIAAIGQLIATQALLRGIGELFPSLNVGGAQGNQLIEASAQASAVLAQGGAEASAALGQGGEAAGREVAAGGQRGGDSLRQGGIDGGVAILESIRQGITELGLAEVGGTAAARGGEDFVGPPVPDTLPAVVELDQAASGLADAGRIAQTSVQSGAARFASTVIGGGDVFSSLVTSAGASVASALGQFAGSAVAGFFAKGTPSLGRGVSATRGSQFRAQRGKLVKQRTLIEVAEVPGLEEAIIPLSDGAVPIELPSDLPPIAVTIPERPDASQVELTPPQVRLLPPEEDIRLIAPGAAAAQQGASQDGPVPVELAGPAGAVDARVEATFPEPPTVMIEEADPLRVEPFAAPALPPLQVETPGPLPVQAVEAIPVRLEGPAAAPDRVAPTVVVEPTPVDVVVPPVPNDREPIGAQREAIASPVEVTVQTPTAPEPLVLPAPEVQVPPPIPAAVQVAVESPEAAAPVLLPAPTVQAPAPVVVAADPLPPVLVPAPSVQVASVAPVVEVEAPSAPAIVIDAPEVVGSQPTLGIPENLVRVDVPDSIAVAPAPPIAVEAPQVAPVRVEVATPDVAPIEVAAPSLAPLEAPTLPELRVQTLDALVVAPPDIPPVRVEGVPSIEAPDLPALVAPTLPALAVEYGVVPQVAVDERLQPVEVRLQPVDSTPLPVSAPEALQVEFGDPPAVDVPRVVVEPVQASVGVEAPALRVEDPGAFPVEPPPAVQVLAPELIRVERPDDVALVGVPATVPFGPAPRIEVPDVPAVTFGEPPTAAVERVQLGVAAPDLPAIEVQGAASPPLPEALTVLDPGPLSVAPAPPVSVTVEVPDIPPVTVANDRIRVDAPEDVGIELRVPTLPSLAVDTMAPVPVSVPSALDVETPTLAVERPTLALAAQDPLAVERPPAIPVVAPEFIPVAIPGEVQRDVDATATALVDGVQVEMPPPLAVQTPEIPARIEVVGVQELPTQRVELPPVQRLPEDRTQRLARETPFGLAAQSEVRETLAAAAPAAPASESPVQVTISPALNLNVQAVDSRGVEEAVAKQWPRMRAEMISDLTAGTSRKLVSAVRQAQARR